MSVVERQELSLPSVAARRRRKRPALADTWWRHVVALIGVVIALFPVAYVVSAAFNGDNSLRGSSLIPSKLTLDNFRSLFGSQRHTTGHATFQNAHYLSWFGNSMIVAGATALLTVLLSALAAYAFSRFRFKGRRMGMMSLLLIQMFPQFGAIAAIYLLVLNVGMHAPERQESVLMRWFDPAGWLKLAVEHRIQGTALVPSTQATTTGALVMYRSRPA